MPAHPLSQPSPPSRFHSRVAAALLGLLVAACSDSAPEDSSAPEDTEEAPTGLECDTLDIRVTGEDPPHVGDAWVVWLWCIKPDGGEVLLTGMTRLVFDPHDIAAVSANNAEFLYAGDASVTVQVGSRRETRDVTVLE